MTPKQHNPIDFGLPRLNVAGEIEKISDDKQIQLSKEMVGSRVSFTSFFLSLQLEFYVLASVTAANCCQLPPLHVCSLAFMSPRCVSLPRSRRKADTQPPVRPCTPRLQGPRVRLRFLQTLAREACPYSRKVRLSLSLANSLSLLISLSICLSLSLCLCVSVSISIPHTPPPPRNM